MYDMTSQRGMRKQELTYVILEDKFSTRNCKAKNKGIEHKHCTLFSKVVYHGDID